jgi:hypothetical protein
MIFRGLGGDWSPYTPLLDEVIGERLRIAGIAGCRSRQTTFGTTLLDQATSYARQGSVEHVVVLEPTEGALITWCDGVEDMILSFERHINELRWEGVSFLRGVVVGDFVADVAGQADTVETYLSMGLERNTVAVLVDEFLSQMPVNQFAVSDLTSVEKRLEGHTGELWITGPCLQRHYDAKSDCEFAWVGRKSASLGR